MRITPKRVVYIAAALTLMWIFIIFDTRSRKSTNAQRSLDPQSEDSVPLKVNGDLGRLIDWHNYTAIEIDRARTGRGEREAFQPTGTERSHIKDSFLDYGYSVYVSDRISLDRSIPDIRHKLCWEKKYHENLPDTSVIMPFHNEAASVLLRSVHSVLNKSPPSLLREIIMVDDASTYKDLLQGAYFETELLKLPKTQIIRLPTRVGLIEARTMGAKAAKAETFTFLDSHIECSYNWLPPLLDRIARNYRSVPQPMIDGIDGTTFKYEEQPGGVMRGSFSWGLLYKRLPINQYERSRMTDEAEPIRTPVQAGGLFSISSRWFWELGGYDPFLRIWGAEQYEMSFKVWMCGGEMEEVGCSRVGHIYRGRMSHSMLSGGGNAVAKNHARIAELWMDEYKHYYLQGSHSRNLDLGDDLEERRKLRQQLKCKSFDWYMKNIAYDQDWYYPAVVPDPYARGKAESVAHPGLCFTVDRLEDCSSRSVPEFEFTWRKDFKKSRSKECVDLSHHAVRSSPGYFDCHDQGGNQLWKYNQDRTIYHPSSNLCLDTNGKSVFMQVCDPASDSQQWNFQHVNFSNYKEDMGPPYDKSRNLKFDQ